MPVVLTKDGRKEIGDTRWTGPVRAMRAAQIRHGIPNDALLMVLSYLRFNESQKIYVIYGVSTRGDRDLDKKHADLLTLPESAQRKEFDLKNHRTPHMLTTYLHKKELLVKLVSICLKDEEQAFEDFSLV